MSVSVAFPSPTAGAARSRPPTQARARPPSPTSAARAVACLTRRLERREPAIQLPVELRLAVEEREENTCHGLFRDDPGATVRLLVQQVAVHDLGTRCLAHPGDLTLRLDHREPGPDPRVSYAPSELHIG